MWQKLKNNTQAQTCL